MGSALAALANPPTGLGIRQEGLPKEAWQVPVMPKAHGPPQLPKQYHSTKLGGWTADSPQNTYAAHLEAQNSLPAYGGDVLARAGVLPVPAPPTKHAQHHPPPAKHVATQDAAAAATAEKLKAARAPRKSASAPVLPQPTVALLPRGVLQQIIMAEARYAAASDAHGKFRPAAPPKPRHAVCARTPFAAAAHLGMSPILALPATPPTQPLIRPPWHPTPEGGDGGGGGGVARSPGLGPIAIKPATPTVYCCSGAGSPPDSPPPAPVTAAVIAAAAATASSLAPCSTATPAYHPSPRKGQKAPGADVASALSRVDGSELRRLLQQIDGAVEKRWDACRSDVFM